jgi:hypothetical protein
LLDDVINFGYNMSFVFAFFVQVGYDFCDAEGVGVEGCLWDESVRERDSEETSNAGCQAQEKEIPVKTCRFSEGKFGPLGD